MKKIFLAGDHYREKLIFKHFDSYQVSKYTLPGGIELLREFLQAGLPNDEIIVLENPGDKVEERIFEVKSFGSVETGPIRINRLIGFSISPGNPGKKVFPVLSGADAILTDDSSISPEMLTSLINESGNKNNFFIFYVPGRPLTKNSLVNKLPDSYIEQFIAVIDVDDLREYGLQINSRLSWDKTLEDFRREFHSIPVFKNLKKCRAFLIRFGLEAVLYVHKTGPEEINHHRIPQHFWFYCVPSMYEGQLKDQTEGDMNGITQAFEAAFVKRIISPDETTLTEREIIAASIIPAMKAASNCLQAGYSKNETSGVIDYPVSGIFKDSNLPVKVTNLTAAMNSDKTISLFSHHTFHSTDLINYLAFRFVKEGISSSFDLFPFTEYNKIKTYDRDEIEGYRGLKQRINSYLSGNENKPLSVAVFGPPGSGKSFGVKQIAEYFKKKISVCEFNLSQFQSYEDLVNAFREITDINLSGKTPFVFFDEFDCDFDGKSLGWLIKFLAPMQDGVYKAGEKIHPLGRTIFVFAGGNFSTYQQFKALISDDDYKKQFGSDNPYISSLTSSQIKSAKIDDFDSRIKWHLNIKGIDRQDERDHLYTLRRAMVLRNILSGYPNIVTQTGRIEIDDDLLCALMIIPKFKHGTRSLETIIKSCGLENKNGFHKAYLPAMDQMKRDIDTEKLEQLMKEQNIFPPELIEPVAEEIHVRWLANEKSKGSVKSTMKPWTELSDDIKDSNRQQAIDMIRKLNAFGYAVVPVDETKSGIDNFDGTEIEQMAKMEQDRWLNEKIAKGWVYGKVRNDQLKIHDCLLAWGELDEKTKDLDRNAVRIIPDLLRSVGFAVVKENSKK